MQSDVIAMVSAVTAAMSVGITFVALLLTLWQSVLTRRALQAQNLVTLKELAVEVRYREGLETILSLQDYTDFDKYLESEPEETRKLIFDTVDFLNFGAHLVEEKVLARQTLYNSYFWAYRTGHDKLIGWWLEGYRRNYPKRFATFERMCRRVGSITEEKIAKFETKHRVKI
jgi:hypothetical protein